MTSKLNRQPQNVPAVDPRTGQFTTPWYRVINDLMVRTGGETARTNTELGQGVDSAQSVADAASSAAAEAQADINAIKLTRLITPLDADFGAKGDGVTDDYPAFQRLLDFLLRPGLDLSTSAAAKASLRGLPRITVELCGRTYIVSQSLSFSGAYNIQFRNGVIKADPTVVWGDAPILNVAAPQATDVVRDQHIRYCSFVDITLDGNGVASLMYLENTFNLTLERVYGLGWPDAGKGLWTSSNFSSPVTKNTNLRIKDCVFMQKDSAEVVANWVSTKGTAVSIKSADFIIDGLIVAFADIGFEIDDVYNGQISNFHSYVKSDQICLSVGANCRHVGFSNIYMDTGLVQLRSFSHKFSTSQFVANSTLQLIATAANEDMAGLDINGNFSNTPQFLTEGSGSWATDFRGRITGGRYDGVQMPSRGKIILGSQSASAPSVVFSDDTTVYSATGFYSPAPNEIRYSANGVDSFGWDSSGRMIVGYGASIPCAQSVTPKIQLHDTSSQASTFSLTRWSSSSSVGGQLALGRSLSNTIGAYGRVTAGTQLGRLSFFGDTGSSTNPIGAYIAGYAYYSDWSTSSAPAVVRVATTPSGSLTPVERWEFRQNGHCVPIGDGLLDIGEPANQLRNIYSQQATFTGPVKLASYTVSTLPSATTYAQCLIYVSNGTSNKRLAISDGTNWRWPDGAIVS